MTQEELRVLFPDRSKAPCGIFRISSFNLSGIEASRDFHSALTCFATESTRQVFMRMDHRRPRAVFFSSTSVSIGGTEEIPGPDRTRENGLDAVASFCILI